MSRTTTGGYVHEGLDGEMTVEFDDGLQVRRSRRRPFDGYGHYPLQSGEDAGTVAQKFNLPQEILSFVNGGTTGERNVLRVPLSRAQL